MLFKAQVVKLPAIATVTLVPPAPMGDLFFLPLSLLKSKPKK